jgi:hypothetical protein
MAMSFLPADSDEAPCLSLTRKYRRYTHPGLLEDMLIWSQGIVDYLLSNKTAYIDEVVQFVEDQFDVTISQTTCRKAMKQAHLTRKVVCGHLPYKTEYIAGRS